MIAEHHYHTIQNKILTWIVTSPPSLQNSGAVDIGNEVQVVCCTGDRAMADCSVRDAYRAHWLASGRPEPVLKAIRRCVLPGITLGIDERLHNCLWFCHIKLEKALKAMQDCGFTWINLQHLFSYPVINKFIVEDDVRLDTNRVESVRI